MLNYVSLSVPLEPLPVTHIAPFVSRFQKCEEEDVETGRACDAEDCGFQMLSDNEIVTSVQEGSDPVNEETDEDKNNNDNESSKGSSNVDAFSALETAMEWYVQQSKCCPTQLLLLKRIRDIAAKKRSCTMAPHPTTVGPFSWEKVADDLAKAATSNPVDPEDHMVHTSTEIYSRAKELICRTWEVPPVQPWYFQRLPSPRSAISFMGSRSYQTAFSRFSTVHLRCMNFEGGKRSFSICTNCNISPFSPQHIQQCLGFSYEEAVASPLQSS
ncbi:RNase H domain-containing protein [Trichonephila clavipes]|nr:RNase H domain-containing protein [Trichonephila clavipes]